MNFSKECDTQFERSVCDFQYDGNDENTFPETESGGWKAAEKFDLLGTWKVSILYTNLVSPLVRRPAFFAQEKFSISLKYVR